MQTWSIQSPGRAVDVITVRLGCCGKNLVAWNKDQFGTVGIETAKLEAQLKVQKDAISRREITVNIRDWRRNEEILC